jgi:hypothetical protein
MLNEQSERDECCNVWHDNENRDIGDRLCLGYDDKRRLPDIVR